MARRDREPTDRDAVERVSHAMVTRRAGATLVDRFREAVVWLLVDVNRWALAAGLAAAVYVATVAVGVFGPVSVREFLLSGTPVADAYIELQPGVITAITVVLAINQLVLSPEFGPLGRQQQRLSDVLSHRRSVEGTADVVSTPTDPSGYLRTVVDAIQEHTGRLAATTSEDVSLDRAVAEFTDGVDAEVEPVKAALAERQFGQIEMLAAAIHYDTATDVHRLHQLRRTHEPTLSADQQRIIDDLLDALEQYTVARQYFQTLYLQSEFIRFSRAMLYTGLPAVLVAHYAVGVIGPSALPGATFGVRNLLWFEAATFTVTMLPIVVIVSFVARLVTLAETSIFISPFGPDGRT